MFGAYAAYVVAISAMLFCAISALTLINTVRHLDSAEARELPETEALELPETVRHKVAV